MFFFDPMYFVVVMLPAVILVGLAQFRVQQTYKKYREVGNMAGLAGWQVAQRLLRDNGLEGVSVERIPGELTDHYDPRDKVLRLSAAVHDTASVAAMGIVAHEVGHALQDARGYAPLKIRAGLVPVANLGSQVGPWLIILGIFMNSFNLAGIGFLLFAGAALFSLVTLPVELNASSRARAMLTGGGMVSVTEAQGVSQVLSAAALTYVAALLVALLQLVYFLLRLQGLNRDD